jgi:dolichol-phosphate mannosyltransferase
LANAAPELSVVVPVYNCGPCLRDLHARLRASVSSISPEFELVFVEDRGGDDSWRLLVDLARHDPAVRAFRLSRNFGQHAAITAGLAQSRGRWVVVMDCDLQDPPEEIPRLYEAARQGHEVVFARRRHKRQGIGRRLAARTYFALLRLFTHRTFEGEYGSFSIISRKVVESFLLFRDQDRHYLFILDWLGFRATSIEYDHAERLAGGSSYTLKALLVHALNGIFAQTTVFLRWIVYLGFAISLSGLALAGFFVQQYFVHSTVPAGFTSLAVLVLFVGGVSILTTGVAGLYVGKIFEQVKGRPLFVIDESVGAGPP